MRRLRPEEVRAFERWRRRRSRARARGEEFTEPNPLGGGSVASATFNAATARKADLEAKAAELGLEVEGTGQDGNVTVADLRAAVTEALEA